MLKACEVVTVLQQLKDFLPCEVIDAHALIYDASFTPALRGNSMFAKARQDAADCFNNIQSVMPGSACDRAVFLPPPEASFGPPLSETRMMNTRFIVHELEKNPASIGAAFVGPDDTIQNIEKMLVHERIRGLKCYFYSCPNRWNAFPNEFLPESAWQIAQAHAMFIVLHLGRAKALGDAGNMEYIQTMAAKFPRAKLVLAHCGRSFSAWTAVGSIQELSRFRNIYYDISSINEVTPIFNCLKYAGKDHVFWGSDFPVSSFIGRAVSIGEQFVWLEQKTLQAADAGIAPVTVLEENLMAAYLAADMLDFTDSDVKALFYTNAENILFSSNP